MTNNLPLAHMCLPDYVPVKPETGIRTIKDLQKLFAKVGPSIHPSFTGKKREGDIALKKDGRVWWFGKWNASINLDDGDLDDGYNRGPLFPLKWGMRPGFPALNILHRSVAGDILDVQYAFVGDVDDTDPLILAQQIGLNNFLRENLHPEIYSVGPFEETA